MAIPNFGPFQAPIQGYRGPKMAIFMAEARPKWQTGSRMKITPGNGLMKHITPKCMEYHCLRPFWPFPFRMKITPGNDSIRHFMCHIIFQYNGQQKKLIYRVKMMQL